MVSCLSGIGMVDRLYKLRCISVCMRRVCKSCVNGIWICGDGRVEGQCPWYLWTLLVGLHYSEWVYHVLWLIVVVGVVV